MTARHHALAAAMGCLLLLIYLVPAQGADKHGTGEILVDACRIAEQYLRTQHELSRAEACQVGLRFGMLRNVTDTTMRPWVQEHATLLFGIHLKGEHHAGR